MSSVGLFPTAVVFSCVLSLSSFAQQKTTDSPPTIDGSQHPELIPDSVAYRLFFRAVSEPPGATPEQVRRQRAKLRPIALEEHDLAAVGSVLAAFHDGYAAFVTDYADAVRQAMATNTQVNVDPWIAQRDSVVEAAHLALKRQLTPLGLERLEAYIQTRKAHMILARPPEMDGSSH